MATYAIGDIQGCIAPLERLLRRLRFSRSDRVWLVGDLVNRGPGSLEVLRWARGLGPRCVAVLGNHDLHLLARAAGVAGPKRRDTLEDVLAAPDREALLAWLRSRPIMHRDGRTLLVHAGIPPAWTATQALAAARACERVLQGDAAEALLTSVSSPEKRTDPLAQKLALLTRIRACEASGLARLEYSGPPEDAPRGCRAWFDIPGRRTARNTIVFGHWAALGLLVSDRVLALDSGCVWGGALTALRLEDRAVFQVPAGVIDAAG